MRFPCRAKVMERETSIERPKKQETTQPNLGLASLWLYICAKLTWLDWEIGNPACRGGHQGMHTLQCKQEVLRKGHHLRSNSFINVSIVWNVHNIMVQIIKYNMNLGMNVLNFKHLISLPKLEVNTEI